MDACNGSCQSKRAMTVRGLRFSDGGSGGLWSRRVRRRYSSLNSVSVTSDGWSTCGGWRRSKSGVRQQRGSKRNYEKVIKDHLLLPGGETEGVAEDAERGTPSGVRGASFTTEVVDCSILDCPVLTRQHFEKRLKTILYDSLQSSFSVGRTPDAACCLRRSLMSFRA